MGDVAVIEARPAEVVGPLPTLDTLAETARREYMLCSDAAAQALGHAISCGEALLKAKEMVEPGTWETWVNRNFPKPGQTRAYMRLAFYRDHLSEFDGTNGMSGALKYLRGLPSFIGNQRAYGPEVITEARRLLAEGLSHREVAGILDVSRRSVWTWSNGEFDSGRTGKSGSRARAERATLKKRARREREARKALRREEEAKAARKAPDSLGESYSMIRKTAQVLDRAAADAEKKPVRDAISVALLRIHAAEEAIVEAVGAA